VFQLRFIVHHREFHQLLPRLNKITLPDHLARDRAGMIAFDGDQHLRLDNPRGGNVNFKIFNANHLYLPQKQPTTGP